jgi:hypothetical protein
MKRLTTHTRRATLKTDSSECVHLIETPPNFLVQASQHLKAIKLKFRMLSRVILPKPSFGECREVGDLLMREQGNEVATFRNSMRSRSSANCQNCQTRPANASVLALIKTIVEKTRSHSSTQKRRRKSARLCNRLP